MRCIKYRRADIDALYVPHIFISTLSLRRQILNWGQLLNERVFSKRVEHGVELFPSEVLFFSKVLLRQRKQTETKERQNFKVVSLCKNDGKRSEDICKTINRLLSSVYCFQNSVSALLLSGRAAKRSR